MSTRRARIKAVTSLPPRRKNADNADNTTKQVPNKECPSTPGSLAKVDSNSVKSPSGKIESPVIKSGEKTPETVKSVTLIDKSNRWKNSVPVTAAASSFRPVFVSPQAKGSPRKKPFPSPVRAPKAADNIAKTILEKDIATVIKPNNTESKEKIQGSDLTKETSNLNVSENKNDTPDDYNISSVPESVTEDAMDGIIPLQPACSAPKPIDLLKNEIISEKAEVLFDPIVPLPSPSKVRPKLRPVPRLAPLRRNSVQGSASESEDESRRALLNSGSAPSNLHRQRHDSQTSQSTVHSIPNREGNRIRNDSICSNISQANAPPPMSTSPVKEKHYPKSRRQEMSRRMAAMRRRRETIKRDNLTMYDLIFYNPDSNPIIPDQDELDAKEANEKEAMNKALENDNENADDPPTTDAMPVPQIKLGPNGEIVLDEQSLVINQSGGNRKVSTVREGAWGRSGNSYRRTARTAEWSDAETVRFYRALAALGTDFTLMQPLFPGRARRDLKLKFKKEEKCNGAQVDKALRSRVEWDAMRLQGEFKEERETAARRAQQARETLQKEKQEQQERKIAAKELGLKQSRCTKALGASVMPDNLKLGNNDNEIINSADDIIRRAKEEKQMKRKRKEPDPVPSPLAPPPPPPQPVQIAPQQCVTSSPFATLTLIQNSTVPQSRRNSATSDLVAVSKQDDPTKATNMPEAVKPVSAVPGSLVVLTVNDPNSPTKKMLQTYIAHEEGVLTPVALPPTLLSSVVGYMKRGTPKSNVSARSSPLLTSPSSVTSHDSRTCVTPSVIQVNPSPTKRQRHSSYTITQL